MRCFNNANRKIQAKWRDEPDRKRMLLRDAITRLGIEVVGWEYEMTRQDGNAIFFHAAVRIGGRLCMIWIYDLKHIGWRANIASRNRKIEHCKLNNIPFCEVWEADTTNMMAQIELWRITMNKIPYREATSATRPKKIRKVNRHFKDRKIY